MQNNTLFRQNKIIVDEKVTLLANRYNLLDEEGHSLGQIKENRSIWRFLIRRYYAPFTLTCYDRDDRILATMHKGWAFLRPCYNILDNEGKLISKIRSRITLIRPKADLFFPNGEKIGSMEGNWIAWNFSVTAPNGRVLATIDKKFNHVLKELFTTADKYIISINSDVTDIETRATLLLTACAIDMIFKEQSQSN